MLERKLCRSRSSASDLIKRKKVTVNGSPATKASMEVSDTDEISVIGGTSYVSRAGEKLAHALDTFNMNPRGMTVLDIGSSTGGFTDCLLQRGAAKIIAIDVGTNQLHESLRNDSRVELHEKTDVRTFNPSSPADLVVADLSFISVEHALPKIFESLRPQGHAIILVKPQFEVGKEIADKYKGIIADPSIRHEALLKVKRAAEKIGFKALGDSVSPIEGEKGNKEFLLFLFRP